MPRNTSTTQEAKTFVPVAEYRVIVDAAKAEGVTVAEYMRRAIRARMASQQINVAFDVQHGGARQSEAALPVSADPARSGVLCIDTAHTPE